MIDGTARAQIIRQLECGDRLDCHDRQAADGGITRTVGSRRPPSCLGADEILKVIPQNCTEVIFSRQDLSFTVVAVLR